MGALPMAGPHRSLRGTHALVCLLSLVAQTHAVRTVMAQETSAQEPSAEERAALLRTVLLLKLIPYLPPDTPPKPPPTVHRIALVGDDPVTRTAARQLPGRKVDERPVEVVVVSAADAAVGKGTEGCSLIYVAADVDAALLQRIVAHHADKPAPIVCEKAGFAAAGGAVQPFVQDNNLRFEVNAETLKKQGIRPSPQLQKLSRRGPR